MAEVLSREFKCLTCAASIKLARSDDGGKWLKFNLDGTPHVDEKKKSSSSNNSETRIAELTKQVSDLKETVNVLISQIQMLRSKVKSKK